MHDAPSSTLPTLPGSLAALDIARMVTEKIKTMLHNKSEESSKRILRPLRHAALKLASEIPCVSGPATSTPPSCSYTGSMEIGHAALRGAALASVLDYKKMQPSMTVCVEIFLAVAA